MTDSDIFFSTPTLKEEVFSLRERHRDLIDKLKRIPHLKIPMDIDLSKIRQETSLITEWAPNVIESDHWSQDEINYHQNNNQGRALIEFTGDSYYMKDTNSQTRPKELVQYHDDGRLKYFVTELGEKMPYITSLLLKICEYPKRCRIMKIPGNYNVNWHSHQIANKHNAPYSMAVIQIPVYSPDCIYNVKSWNPEFPEEFPVNYNEGECYLFNSYNFHKVINKSPDPRVSIFATYSFDYEPFLKFLEPLVDAYGGPYIKM